jgi:hypothetical protein
MKHLVTVRADRAHIAAWHHLISLSNLGDRDKVVNMNESISDVAIARLKVKAAYGTVATKEPNAFLACGRIALVRVHRDGAPSAFLKFARIDLRRILDRCARGDGFNPRGLKQQDATSLGGQRVYEDKEWCPHFPSILNCFPLFQRDSVSRCHGLPL